MKIIGLTAFAKSGKSTAAEILKEMGGKEVAFANHLKDVCSAVFSINRNWFDDQSLKEKPFLLKSPKLDTMNIIAILNAFEVSGRFIPETVKKHEGTLLLTPRHMAQYVGTEILRSIDENIHINMALSLNSETDAKFLICSDMRFQNELNAVNDRNGLTIGITRKASTPLDLINLHGSEKEIPSLVLQSKFQVENEGTIEDFQNRIKTIVNSYF